VAQRNIPLEGHATSRQLSEFLRSIVVSPVREMFSLPCMTIGTPNELRLVAKSAGLYSRTAVIFYIHDASENITLTTQLFVCLVKHMLTNLLILHSRLLKCLFSMLRGKAFLLAFSVKNQIFVVFLPKF